MWQYTATGSVAGIAGNVDRNEFNGTVNWVQIDIDENAEDLDHLITPEERYKVAMARQ